MAELVYVDEQRTQANQVLRAAVVSKEFTKDEVVAVIPSATIDETIDIILEHNCKVLIADYKLSEHKADVEFTGADLVREFQRRFARFPCFVTTSFTEEAINEALDTNMIFPKSDFLSGGEGGLGKSTQSELPFFVRVRKKIAEHESYVNNISEELDKLRAKSETEPLSAEEAQRLIELDDMVEAVHGQHLAVKSHLKQQALKTFEKIIDKAETLIKKIEDELEEK